MVTKTFQLEVFNQQRLLLGISVWIVLLILFGQFIHLGWVAFMLLASLWSLRYFHSWAPMEIVEVTLSEKGLGLSADQRIIPWDNLRWYRLDFNHPLGLLLVLRTESDWRPLRFFTPPQGELLGDWQRFRKGLVFRAQKKNPAFRNYFDHPFWKAVPYILGIVWAGVLFYLIIKGVHWGRLDGLVIAFFASIRLWLMIRKAD